jgi:hypothetical protein
MVPPTTAVPGGRRTPTLAVPHLRPGDTGAGEQQLRDLAVEALSEIYFRDGDHCP